MTGRPAAGVAGAALLLLLGSGCISTVRYGVENVTDLAKVGDPEKTVIEKHGAPDEIMPVSKARYIYVYRIVSGSVMLDVVYGRDSFQNLSYMVDGGQITGVGLVDEGSGTRLLRAGITPHPKARDGHGGDARPAHSIVDGLGRWIFGD